MTKKPLRLVDAAKLVRPSKHGPKSWFERLSDEHRDELLATKAQWKAGVPQASARAFAAWLVAQCRERGIATCTAGGVSEWLLKD